MGQGDGQQIAVPGPASSGHRSRAHCRAPLLGLQALRMCHERPRLGLLVLTDAVCVLKRVMPWPCPQGLGSSYVLLTVHSWWPGPWNVLPSPFDQIGGQHTAASHSSRAVMGSLPPGLVWVSFWGL